MSDFERTLNEAIVRRSRYEKRRTYIAALLCVLVAVYLGLTWSEKHTASSERQSLIHAVELLRWQQQQCASLPAGAPECVEPIVPPASEILDDPAAVPTAPPAPAILSSAMLENAAKTVIDAALPEEVAKSVAPAVESYVGICVQVGDCVGPPGPVGADGAAGAPPSPEQLAQAVAQACQATVDCEVTDQEIVDGVAAYCSMESEPCGHKWTEDEIRHLAIQEAKKEISEWSFGRPWFCVPEDEVPNDKPFGPCYASVG